MLRYFLVLAVTDGSLLIASFVLGLMATGEPRGPGAIWHGIHVLFALMTTMATLAVHIRNNGKNCQRIGALMQCN